MDYRFHTKEQQDFYATILLDKKPIVCDMKWVDWKFIDENEDYFPGVHESFRSCGVDKFVGQELTKWNDELIMQFYSLLIFIQMVGLYGCLRVQGTSQLLMSGPS